MKDIELINKYTQRQFSEDEVFVFPVRLCDNDIDRDFEAFDDESLEKLAKLFVGKTGLFDHSESANDQNARIFFTEIRTDCETKNSLGEPLRWLFAKAYMVRTDENASLIREIEAGIKKEVSIGVSVRKRTCSICGNEIDSPLCGHHRGREYGGKPCFATLSDVCDAYEWSFVAVPAQRNSGVSKSFSSDCFKKYNEQSGDFVFVAKSELKGLVESLENLEESASYGELYRQSLIDGIKKHFALNLPKCRIDSVLKFVSTLSPKELADFSESVKEMTVPTAKVQLCST